MITKGEYRTRKSSPLSLSLYLHVSKPPPPEPQPHKPRRHVPCTCRPGAEVCTPVLSFRSMSHLRNPLHTHSCSMVLTLPFSSSIFTGKHPATTVTQGARGENQDWWEKQMLRGASHCTAMAFACCMAGKEEGGGAREGGNEQEGGWKGQPSHDHALEANRPMLSFESFSTLLFLFLFLSSQPQLPHSHIPRKWKYSRR